VLPELLGSQPGSKAVSAFQPGVHGNILGKAVDYGGHDQTSLFDYLSIPSTESFDAHR
jgi:hypothetical protein